jgi:hypothetical protein
MTVSLISSGLSDGVAPPLRTLGAMPQHSLQRLVVLLSRAPRARTKFICIDGSLRPPPPPPPNCSEHLSNGATAVHVVTLDWLHTHGTPAEDRAT